MSLLGVPYSSSSNSILYYFLTVYFDFKIDIIDSSTDYQ